MCGISVKIKKITYQARIKIWTITLLISRDLEHLFGEDDGTPLKLSCLENPMDGGAW